ncbi:MAG TPA: carbohydrate ABC transporter permease [Armatimonadota bacterium]|nr:carbohydrate ABC transporter permease [Armatimonadota bacterium]
MNKSGIVKKIAFYLILGLGAITMLIPLLWMISTSMKQPGEVFDAGATLNLLPKFFVWKSTNINGQHVLAWWQNYPDAWSAINFTRLYLNSIFIALVGTAGQVITSSMAAYAFARLKFPGRDKLFFAYLATMMIPGSVTMIPVFILLKSLGLVNTYTALIVPGMFSAYGTFLLRQFFMGLPKELEESAKMDGAGYLAIWWRVILPLAKPALATLTTFTFLGFWGSYMWPLIVTITEPLRTLPIGLRFFVGMHSTNYTQLMAGSTLVILPVLIMFLLNQRYFVEGIKLSGMGGK